MRRGVVARVRDLVPIRPLTRLEAMRVAELQAARFRELLELDDPCLPEEAIAGLPRVQVERMSPFPVSGATNWSHGRWLIVLNAAESATRTRFSLAHELKHILDHRFIDTIYEGTPQAERGRWIEQVCDYFAACLLMPRPMVKRLYYSGIQRLPELAARFQVSQQAMQVRLNQIGLVDPPARCGGLPRAWALRAARAAGSSVRYHRSPGLVTT